MHERSHREERNQDERRLPVRAGAAGSPRRTMSCTSRAPSRTGPRRHVLLVPRRRTIAGRLALRERCARTSGRGRAEPSCSTPRRGSPGTCPTARSSHHQPMPEPLISATWCLPTGVSMTCLEPGMRYRVGYHLDGRDDFRADLVFAGIDPADPARVGRATLRDRFALRPAWPRHRHDRAGRRDRSRSTASRCATAPGAHVPRSGSYELQLGYCFGATSPDDGFLAFAMAPPTDPMSETFHLFGGYLFRGGTTTRLAELTRRNVATRRAEGSSGSSSTGSTPKAASCTASGPAEAATRSRWARSSR